MTAARRVFGALLVALLCVLTTAASAGVAAAATRPVDAGSAPPPAPVTLVATVGPHTIQVCVKNYAPNSDVAVTDTQSGETGTIHTDASGSGCVTIHFQQACHTLSHLIKATGIDQSGKPATSDATVTSPPNQSLCAATRSGGGKVINPASVKAGGGTVGPANQGGVLPFTGADILAMVLVALGLISMGALAVASARRRRSTTAA